MIRIAMHLIANKQYKRALIFTLAVNQVGWIFEVGHVRQLVGFSQRPQNLRIDLVTNVGSTLQSHHVSKTGSAGIVIGA
jgi:hypothetical protein